MIDEAVAASPSAVRLAALADDEYRLGEELGSGAIATVVRVHGPRGQIFAGKILHASREADPNAAARFEQEAAFASTLEHPNIARAYGHKSINGHDVLLMELLEGLPLDKHLAVQGALPWQEVRALTHARQQSLSRASK